MLIADPLQCLIQVFAGVGIVFVSEQLPLLCHLWFSEHPHPLQELCEEQSAPCLQGANIPLEPWVGDVNQFLRAGDAQPSAGLSISGG